MSDLSRPTRYVIRELRDDGTENRPEFALGAMAAANIFLQNCGGEVDAPGSAAEAEDTLRADGRLSCRITDLGVTIVCKPVEACDECGESVPQRGSLISPFHAKSCSLYCAPSAPRIPAAAPDANFNRHGGAIADAYAALLRTVAAQSPASAPQESDDIRAAWRELAEDSVDRAAGIRLLLDVEETDETPEPYDYADEMMADIARGHFAVSTLHCEHPLWTPAENVAFRIVHDVLGHYAASVAQARPGTSVPSTWVNRSQGQFIDADSVAGFDWVGEVAACNAHVRLLPTVGARKALFTECLAQTAYAIQTGSFGPQVVGFTGCYLPEPVHSEYMKFINRKAS